MRLLLLVFFAFCLAARAGAAQAPDTGGFCPAPDLGAPCATGGLATLGGSTPSPGFSLGNPVHLGSGNKYQLDIDLPANVSAPGLEIVRHYNSLSTQTGSLGRNWTLSYDTYLRRRPQGWQLRQADGSSRDIGPVSANADGFAWPSPDGRELQFDAQGRLIGVKAGRAQLIRIHRHTTPPAMAGLIQRVDDADGRSLQFHYEIQDGQTVLQAVDTPLGRFHYRYGRPAPDSGYKAPRLEAVTRPDGMRRAYHYEAAHQAGNPYALTGISLSRDTGPAHRLATWEYDSHARVTGMRQHGRATPALQLEYLRAKDRPSLGITRVRSANGLQGDIRFQRSESGYRLLSRHLATPDARADAVEYDAQGRLTGLTGPSGLRLQRTPHGAAFRLTLQEPGWPGLALELQREPALYAWHSQDTGRSALHADPQGRPARLEHANGDTLDIRYDPQGRPAYLAYRSGRTADRADIQLQWHGRQLLRIQHPQETETRAYDGHGRIQTRIVQRPAQPGSPALRLQEGFHHDEQGRLRRHDLPEGGALHYEWRDHKLAALRWEDARGEVRTVIASEAGLAGYRYGNGLQLRTEARHSVHADTLLLADHEKILWRQHRRYDAQGRVASDQQEFPLAGHQEAQRYVYDARSRLIGAQHERAGTITRWWYAWRANGALAAWKRDAQSRLAGIQRDASGLPMRVDGYLLRYGPGRRLASVTQADTGHTIARYRHNAFGHRIAKHAAGIATHYLYLDNRLVAEAHSPADGAPPRITRRYLHAGLVPVGMIIYPESGPPELYAVHADLSGAPRMLTDAHQDLRWLAGYTPTGQARRLAGDLHFPLRFPGQYADEETGWHDNLLRTYAPQLGQYLEPDPLGPLPGADAYGYARQQPWRHADPLGLLLFAFDGTRYSADSRSNTWLLAQAYNDGAAHYHSGPGNSLFLDWDAVTAWNAGRILENQWQALLTSLERQPAGVTVPVDIIGFSRGAALARHFGNRIAGHTENGLFSVEDPLRGRVSACVDLRFMGLFDTVTQFGIAGSHNHLYDFGVAEIWSWVSHAVALHEHRWAFPLTSAAADGAGNVVEAPFVGAHSDIGGGLALLGPSADPDASDSGADDTALAQVALAWMRWQALAASVDVNALPEPAKLAQTASLRDLRSPLARSIQRGDRAVDSVSGAKHLAYQDDHPRLGRTARAQTESFIQRPDNWRSQSGQIVGAVDMEGYGRWLEETLGWSPP